MQYLYPMYKPEDENSMEGQLRKQDFKHENDMSSGGIRDKIQQMRAVVIRPPILVWDEKIWNGDIPSEEQIQAQIKSRTAYYCRICFSQ